MDEKRVFTIEVEAGWKVPGCRVLLGPPCGPRGKVWRESDRAVADRMVRDLLQAHGETVQVQETSTDGARAYRVPTRVQDGWTTVPGSGD